MRRVFFPRRATAIYSVMFFIWKLPIRWLPRGQCPGAQNQQSPETVYEERVCAVLLCGGAPDTRIAAVEENNECRFRTFVVSSEDEEPLPVQYSPTPHRTCPPKAIAWPAQ